MYVRGISNANGTNTLASLSLSLYVGIDLIEPVSLLDPLVSALQKFQLPLGIPI